MGSAVGDVTLNAAERIVGGNKRGGSSLETTESCSTADERSFGLITTFRLLIFAM